MNRPSSKERSHPTRADVAAAVRKALRAISGELTLRGYIKEHRRILTPTILIQIVRHYADGLSEGARPSQMRALIRRLEREIFEPAAELRGEVKVLTARRSPEWGRGANPLPGEARAPKRPIPG